MKTTFQLMAQYETLLIPVKSVAQDYFGVSNQVLLRKVDAGTIPLPITKMEESQKAAKYVHIEDLAAYIEARRSEAQRDFERLHN